MWCNYRQRFVVEAECLALVNSPSKRFHRKTVQSSVPIRRRAANSHRTHRRISLVEKHAPAAPVQLDFAVENIDLHR
jgi:hypothetical protein